MESLFKKNNLLANFFDAVFIINLPGRHKRLQTVSKELMKLGVNKFERFEAMRPRFQDIPKIYYSEMSMAPGALNWESYVVGSSGCKMSHLGIIQIAKERGLQHILILEDDTIFKWRSLNKLLKSIAELPEDWDIIYFGGQNLTPPAKYGKYISRVTSAYGAFAYGVNLRIANHIINSAPISGKEIDVFYADEIQPQGNCFISDPKLAKVRPGWSDILETEVNYDSLLS